MFARNLDGEDVAHDLDENGTIGKGGSDVAVMGGSGIGERGMEDGGALVVGEEIPRGESSIISIDADEEMDMLANVQQMAASVATSRQESKSFEDQVCPLERYAIEVFGSVGWTSGQFGGGSTNTMVTLRWLLDICGVDREGVCDGWPRWERTCLSVCFGFDGFIFWATMAFSLVAHRVHVYTAKCKTT